MIYNGFRRIALAHSLLPALPVAEANRQAEDRDGGMLEKPLVRGTYPDSGDGAGLAEAG
jgi:hypothetical protein